jgi:hypothetical protein
MAKAAKRRVGPGGTGSDGGGSSGRATPPKSSAQRYTPPTRASKGPSPRWVPVVMFGLWGLGLLVIILNYMMVLPGTSDGGNGWYLLAGLMSILGGILTATQYR